MAEPIRIAIAAGEASGDQIAAQLIPALQQQFPDCDIAGVAGNHMVAAGCRQIIDLQDISVMGIVEILKSIPRILRCRRQFLTFLSSYQPDIFIGVDAPDFNLPIEEKLHANGVFTVHYNSPKVWAWRRYRVKKIQRAVSLMLTQFPFEADFYQPYQVAAEYVGHPFADVIHATPKALQSNAPVIGLALGSRESEVKRHSELFLKTAAWLHQRIPGCQFVVPMLNEKRKADFLNQYDALGIELPIDVCVANFRDAIATTDCVLTAAGTATLEIMLLQKPMVVTYQLSALTYAIGKRLVHVKHIALPNLLANERLVPEIIQNDATPESLGQAVLTWIEDPEKTKQLLQRFNSMQQQLAGDAAPKAAEHIAAYFSLKQGVYHAS